MEKEKKAFTLLELMVVIALIWIMALSISKLNFNSLSDRQRIDWFFYKIKTDIETTQNNAFIWKAIKLPDDSIIVPKKWKIDFNNSWSWKIISKYLSWSTEYIYSEIIPKKHYKIEIFNKNNPIDDTETGSILIEWWNLTLSWITTTNKILEIKTSYKNFSKTFTINTISWVIEEE